MHGSLAYLDAGTGSMIIQAVVGGVAAAAVAGRLFFRRVWGFITFKNARAKRAAQD